jgi:hypothetical protein
MARPSAEILDKITTKNHTDWYILAADDYYVVTYKGQPVNLKSVSNTMSQAVKYKKTGYTNEGNCRVSVRKLNEIFMTEDFSYVKLRVQNEITY